MQTEGQEGGVMSTPVSPHFTLEELVHSDYALRHGIDNATADPGIIRALTALALNVLEPIRAHYGLPFAPTSGFRCPELNRAINGAANSQHMVGEAADIVLPGMTRLELAQWIEHSLDFDQLILECYIPGEPNSGWVHCSYRSTGGNRKELLTYTAKGHQYLRGLNP
jgi:hypothetical protein